MPATDGGSRIQDPLFSWCDCTPRGDLTTPPKPNPASMARGRLNEREGRHRSTPGAAGGGHAPCLCLTRMTNGGSSQMGKESVEEKTPPMGTGALQGGAAGGPQMGRQSSGGRIGAQAAIPGRRNPPERRSAEVGSCRALDQRITFHLPNAEDQC